ncbi:MAG: OmpA/MotB domain protein [Gemmatimonadetes bacterium]|jgi:outer membrane protein OmpA-like peptidoglycan-associated protein|nr:OmpA/MotB domain protein [Gemmatimonadota bacterium]
MPVSTRTLTACAVAMLSLSACATKGALRQGLEDERSARIAADNEQRAEIAALRTDLRGLRTEFGARIAEVADGLQFAFPVHFAYDDATVRSADHAALDRFATVVQRHYPGAKITVEGFADPAGSAQYNLALSQRRAEAVRRYVNARGIDPSLVNAVGYGKSRLVRRDAARAMPGAELNRRVVFVVETPANAVRTMAMKTNE